MHDANEDQQGTRGGAEPRVPCLVVPSTSGSGDAWRDLQSRDITVMIEHDEGDRLVFEILATRQQVEQLRRSGRFSICARGPLDGTAVEGCDASLNAVLERWNVRFREDYAQQHRTHDHDVSSIASLSAASFDSILSKEQLEPAREVHKLLRQSSPAGVYPVAHFVLPTLVGAGALGEAEDSRGCVVHETVRNCPEGEVWRLRGRVGVSVFIIDAHNDARYRFDEDDAGCVAREVVDGLSWLAEAHPTSDLTFVCAFHRVSVRFEPEWEALDEAGILREWLATAVKRVDGLNTLVDKVDKLTKDHLARRFAGRGTDHDIAIFVTAYRNPQPLSEKPKVTICKCRNWYGRGRAQLDGMVVHEVLHAFGALDEYVRDESRPPCASMGTLPEDDGSKAPEPPWNDGTPSPRISKLLMKGITVLIDPDVLDKKSCDKEESAAIPNNNHIQCARPHQPCIMGYYPRQLCEYTKAQVGWVDLLVEIETRRSHFAGTDSRVWLDIGHRQLELDIIEHDDRWPGHRAAYGFPSVERGELRRLLLRKAPGGAWNDWQLRRVRAWHRNELVYDHVEDRQDEAWLDDRDPVWLAPESGWRAGLRNDPSLVHSLVVEITSSGALAGDELELELDGHRWIVGRLQPSQSDEPRAERFNLDPGVGLRPAIGTMAVRRLGSGARSDWQLHELRILCNGASLQPLRVPVADRAASSRGRRA